MKETEAHNKELEVEVAADQVEWVKVNQEAVIEAAQLEAVLVAVAGLRGVLEAEQEKKIVKTYLWIALFSPAQDKFNPGNPNERQQNNINLK